MKNIVKLSGIIVLVAVIGFSFAACSNGSTDTPETTKFNGTWKKAPLTLVISGTEYTILNNDDNYRKGAFSYTDTTFTAAHTHEWEDNDWAAGTFTPATFNYTMTGNTLEVSGGTGGNAAFNGSWTK